MNEDSKSHVLPLVSVCMITYNHERYIKEAIDSVLMQDYAGPIEIVIGDDCSTDGTSYIIDQYQREHPQIVRVLRPEMNIGMMRNLSASYQACRGKYIALLEGDDRWSYRKKLSKQVEKMEGNPNITLCFHRSVSIDAMGDFIDSDPYPPNHIVDPNFSDFLQLNPCHTATVMYRKQSDCFSEGWNDLGLGDWPLHILHAKNGQIVFLREIMAHYRVHDMGVWTSCETSKKIMHYVNAFMWVADKIPPVYTKTLYNACHKLVMDVSRQFPKGDQRIFDLRKIALNIRMIEATKTSHSLLVAKLLFYFDLYWRRFRVGFGRSTLK